MTERKSPARGEALIHPGKADQNINTTSTNIRPHSCKPARPAPTPGVVPVNQIPEGVRRVRPSYVLVKHSQAGWDVSFVCFDCAETKQLSSWEDQADALGRAKVEADRRGVLVYRASLMSDELLQGIRLL